MRFKLDENLLIELLDDLRTAANDADGLRDEGLIGAPDNAVLALARHSSRRHSTMKRIGSTVTGTPATHAVPDAE